MNIYVEMFLIGLIGIAFQIGLKVRSLQDKAYAANVEFVWKEYFKKDLLSVVLSFLAVVLAEFFIRDTMVYFQNSKLVMPLMKLTFATIGYAGADISNRLFGKYSKMLNGVIDRKTNIADGIE